MSRFKAALLSAVVLSVACLSHPVFADQRGNVIVSETNLDSAGKTFEVTAQQSDSGRAIKGINVAIWFEENGQDDLKWYINSNVSGGGKSRFSSI